MKTLIISSILALSATTANAWGDKEQGALAGILGTLIFQQIHKQQQPQPSIQPPVVIQQRVEPIIIYVPPLPPLPQAPYCMYHPFHDAYGRLIGYTKSCH
jgi:hypothetical protein